MGKISRLMEGIEAAIGEEERGDEPKAADVDGELSGAGDDLDEEKKITSSNVTKAAQRLASKVEKFFTTEMEKLGVKKEWDDGWLYHYVSPIIVATAVSRGADVDNTALTSAKSITKSILGILSKGQPAEEDIEAMAEAIGESLINRMTQAMVQSPKFQKLLQANDKYIAKRAFIVDDLALAVKNALVMTLAQHDASLAGSLPGQAKRDTKKSIASS